MVGLAGGAYWLYKKGRNRDTVAEKVSRALRAKDYATAAQLTRQMVAKDPSNKGLVQLLLDTLIQARRYEEAEAAANERLNDPALADTARRALCAIAFEQGDVAKADRIARTLADTDAPFAHRVLAFIQDRRGIVNSDPRLRLAAANMMRDLAAVTEEEADRVQALLFSASVTLEVTDGIETASHFVRQAREDLKAAVVAADKAHKANRQFPFDYILARIHILSDKPDVAAKASERLRDYTSADRRDSAAIAQRILHHARLGDEVEALDLVRDLRDQYQWYRVMWVLQRRWPVLALKALEQTAADDPIQILMRVGLLLRKEENYTPDVAKAQELVKRLADNPNANTGIIVAALQTLAIRGGIDAARTVAQEANLADRKDRRMTALLAVLLNAKEGDRERADALVRELARNADPETEGPVLRLLGQGRQLVDSYFDAKIEKGGGSAMKYRLSRALANLARAAKEKDSERAKAMREKVTRDLKIVLDDPEAKRRALLDGFWLASSLGDSGLAGQLLGLALVREGRPEALAIRILEIAERTEDRAVVKAIAKGIEAIAPKSGSPVFLRAFSAIFAEKVDESAIDVFEKAAEGDEPARRQSLELACRIALTHAKYERGEALARRLLEAAPDGSTGRELLGAVLVLRNKPEATVELWTGIEKPSEAGYRQLIGAHIQLEQLDKAKEVAEVAIEKYPHLPGPYLLLADIYERRDEIAKALGILNLAPPIPFVTLKRAMHMYRLEEYAASERLYMVLLGVTKFRDHVVWTNLSRVMNVQERGGAFLELSAKVLHRKLLEGDAMTLSLIHFLRGETLEQGGQVSQALGEYEKAIGFNPKFWTALNNAAWHISTLQRTRIRTAKDYIDKALELQPDNPAVLDTAAEVYVVLKQFDRSIELIEKAIAKSPEQKKVVYVFHKAELFLRAGRKADALETARLVQKTWPDHENAKKAAAIVAELEPKD